MKILHVNHLYREFGGGERYLLDICAAQEESGHETAVISSAHENNVITRRRGEYFIEPSFGLKSGKRMWPVVEEIVAREAPDIIHLHETLVFLSPYIVKRLMGLKPVVQTLHTAFFFCPQGTKILPCGDICAYPMGRKCFTKCLGRFNLKLAVNMYWRALVTKKSDKIIAPSQYIRREAILNHIPDDRVEVIPHFTMKNPEGKRVEPEEGTVLFVGRADPLKGIGEFIKALSLLDVDWRAIIVAGGEIAEYREMAEGLGLASKIEFIGGLDYDALDEYYKKAALIVFPSMSMESFGLVGIEAMSLGRPVVAFDSGGPAEWLSEGETGFLLKRGDVKGLASAIKRLLEDEDMARAMGERAIKDVGVFRKGPHVKRLLSLYKGAITGRA